MRENKSVSREPDVADAPVTLAPVVASTGAAARPKPERLKIALTVYSSATDNTGTSQVTRWASMIKKFKKPTVYPTKEKSPLFAASTFNGTREAENLISFDAVVADYDGKVVPGISLEEMCQRLTNAHVEAVVYTTARHTATAPRLRVVAPLLRTHVPSEHGELMDLLNGAVGGCLDAESWHPWRMYYFGAVKGVDYACQHVSGMPLDEAAIFLDSIGKPGAVGKAQAEASHTLARAAGADTDLGRVVAIARVNEKTLADVRSALQFLDPDSHELWTTVGQNLKCLGDRGKGLWLEWSARSPKFRDGKTDPDRVWDGLSGDRSDYRAVFTKAQAAGWINPGSARAGVEVDSSTVIAELDKLKRDEVSTRWVSMAAALEKAGAAAVIAEVHRVTGESVRLLQAKWTEANTILRRVRHASAHARSVDGRLEIEYRPGSQTEMAEEPRSRWFGDRRKARLLSSGTLPRRSRRTGCRSPT